MQIVLVDFITFRSYLVLICEYKKNIDKKYIFLVLQHIKAFISNHTFVIINNEIYIINNFK